MSKVRKIDVCSACFCRSCWDGLFYCISYKSAGFTQKSLAELQRLNRENEDYYMPYFNDPSLLGPLGMDGKP